MAGVRFNLDKHLHDTISHLCERPTMYTRNGTFGEVVAYLTGYIQGSDAKGLAADAQLQAFEHWLQQRLGYPANRFWDDILSDAFPEGQALGQFRLLFDEYKSAEAQGEVV